MEYNRIFSLRWDDFSSSLTNCIGSLREDGDLVDVTIACDGQTFAAHKVILSACSNYLRGLLKRNPSQHPVIFVHGMKASILQAILQFIYHGIADVPEAMLQEFLDAGQSLHIQGLQQKAQTAGYQESGYKRQKYVEPAMSKWNSSTSHSDLPRNNIGEKLKGMLKRRHSQMEHELPPKFLPKSPPVQRTSSEPIIYDRPSMDSPAYKSVLGHMLQSSKNLRVLSEAIQSTDQLNSGEINIGEISITPRSQEKERHKKEHTESSLQFYPTNAPSTDSSPRGHAKYEDVRYETPTYQAKDNRSDTPELKVAEDCGPSDMRAETLDKEERNAENDSSSDCNKIEIKEEKDASSDGATPGPSSWSPVPRTLSAGSSPVQVKEEIPEEEDYDSGPLNMTYGHPPPKLEQCKYCGKSFWTQQKLLSHMSRSHGMVSLWSQLPSVKPKSLK